jgi:ankyrin repeat protein
MQTASLTDTTQPSRNSGLSLPISGNPTDSISAGSRTIDYPSSPLRLQIDLTAVSVNAFAQLMENSDDPVSIFNAQEQKYYILMHNLQTPIAHQIFNSNLITAVPCVDTAEWAVLRNQPLAASLTDAEYCKALLKKFYISSWDLLLESEGLSNQQVSTLMRLVLDLLPHISNARSYVKKLFAPDSSDEDSSREYSFDTDPSESTSLENTSSKNISPQNISPENSFFENDSLRGEIFDALTFRRFERLAHVDLDRCLYPILKHFPIYAGSPAYNFIIAQCPVLANLNCLEEIQSHYTSFLFYIVDKYPLAESTARDALIALFDKFLEQGGDLEQTDQQERTALVRLLDFGFEEKFYNIHYQKGVIELAAYLLQHGADCNARDKYGLTPLMEVCRSRYEQDELISLLCKYSQGDINTTDNKGNTALHIAGGNNIAHLQALLRYLQIDVNRKNDLDENVLHVVISYDNFPKLQLLLQQLNIDVNAKNNEEESVLHYAMRAGNLRIIQALLEHPSIDVNVQDKKGNGALHWAIRHNNVPLVERLLGLGKKIDVNMRNKKGDTALHIALKYGWWPIAQVLLEQTTINVNIKAKRGRALEIAIRRSDLPLSILQALLKKSGNATCVTAFNYAIYSDKDYIFLSSEEHIARTFLEGKNEQEKNIFIDGALKLAEKEKLYEVIDILCEEYGVVSEFNKFEDEDY